MRPGVEWMNRENDDPILEALDEVGWAVPPKVLEYNLETRNNTKIKERTLANRLSLLLEYGLIEKEREEGGYYSITDRGRRYLRGDISSEELEDPA